MENITKLNILGVLYLIGKPKDRPFRHRIRLQKFVLLAEKEFGYPFHFKYQSYYYGPYSEELLNLVMDLVHAGYVKENANELPNGNFEFFYELTKSGEKRLKDLSSGDKGNLKKLNLLWDNYNTKSTGSIVAAAKKEFAKATD